MPAPGLSTGFDPDGSDDEGQVLRVLPSLMLQPLAMTAFGGRLLVVNIIPARGGDLPEIVPGRS